MKKSVMKGGLIFGAVFLIFGILAMEIVSAEDEILTQAINILEYIIGDFPIMDGFSLLDVVFIKLMVLFLILIITYFAAKNIPGIGENGVLSFFIALIVSLLAVRYLTTSELITFIWAPYGILGVVLSSLFVFILAFFFINSFGSSVIRKVGWTTFLVIYLGLGISRWNDLRITQTGPLKGYSLAWVYIIIAAVSGLLILWDKKISGWVAGYFATRKSLKEISKSLYPERAEIKQELINLNKKLAHADDEDREGIENLIATEQKKLARINVQIKHGISGGRGGHK